MTTPSTIFRPSGFVRRHLVAFGSAIAGFTIICFVIYVVGICTSRSGFGSPAMPFLVPIFAALFSFIYTFTVVVPSCVIGERLFAGRLHFRWYLHLLATCVLFGGWLWASIAIFDRFVTKPIFNLPAAVRWFAFFIPFAIYWPVSQRARF